MSGPAMRYIPHTESEIKEMLSVAGVHDVESLFNSIPAGLKLKAKLALPSPLSEQELTTHANFLGSKNSVVGQNISFLGAGNYQHYIPAALSDIASRGEWVTPYTPYQPEISQGTLQAIFEYQSMICRLTGMDTANASHYDGATSTAEAALMAINKTRKNTIVVAETLHPEYRDTIKTILKPQNKNIVTVPFGEDGRISIDKLKEALSDDVAGVIVQSPNFFGIIEDMPKISDAVHQTKALFIASTTEAVSWGILRGAGEFGADIVTAEGQSFGSGMNFGGPCLGIFAAKSQYLRSMPGRIVGQTTDKDGKRGFVLTMSTREQHIRREKATSNICSNEALLATTAAIYLSLLGKEGLKKLAEINLRNSEYLKSEISKISGMKIRFHAPTFNEFVVDTGKDTNAICSKLLQKKIFAGVPLEGWYPALKNCLLVCSTECHDKAAIDKFITELKNI